MGIAIRVQGADGTDRRLEFDLPKITVGSGPHCHVTLDDEAVDREQAVLVTRGGRSELFDIGTTRGVRVNGKPVGHCILSPGDEICVGSSILTLDEAKKGVQFTLRGEGNISASVKADSIVIKPKAPEKSPAQLSEEDQRLMLLQEVSRLINAIAHNEDIFESILDTIFLSASVRRAFIALLDDAGELQVKAHRNREKRSVGEAIEVSRTLLGKVVKSGEAVLTTDAESDPDLSAIHSIQKLQIRAAVCVPLILEGKVIGVIYGDNRERPGTLTPADLSYLSTLASLAAVAVEQYRLLSEYDAKRKIEQALSIARSIQRNFLPSGPPDVDGFDIWGSSDSCDETGGDYYDFLRMEDGRVCAVIADVSGHGIGPALLMASIRASLRALVEPVEKLEDLLPRINRLLCADIRDGRFVTLFLAAFDPQNGLVQPIGAGHPELVWYRAKDRTIEQIGSRGPPLGVLVDTAFPAASNVALEPGDILLMSTDGILEAANGSGEQFGMERMSEVVRDQAGGTSEEVVAAIFAQVDRFVGGRRLIDDATLVAIKRT